MLLTVYLVAVVATLSLAAAKPAPAGPIKSSPDLRLIKTSATGPGIWVTEEEKISKYRAKKINFIDVTDIKDPETLRRLSGDAAAEDARVAAVVYPTTITHQTQANALIANANTTGPKSWLRTLSE